MVEGKVSYGLSRITSIASLHNSEEKKVTQMIVFHKK